MITTTIEIAEEAAKILMRYFDGSYEKYFKDQNELVTTADIESDALIRERLKAAFPNDQILSEETANTVNDYSGRVWIVDPLDGTRQFTQKNQYFGINIGLAVDGISTLGVVILPVRNEIYFAEKGKGAFRKKDGAVKKIIVSDTARVCDARLATIMTDGVERELDPIINKLHVKEKLPISSIGVLFAAAGEVDMYIHATRNLKKWDTCAPQVILEEAGGMVSDLDGNALNYRQLPSNWNDFAIMTNSFLHREVLSEIHKLKEK